MNNPYMDVGDKKYADFMRQIAALLNSSYEEIKSRYTKFLRCELNVSGNGKEYKTIGIRFEDLEISVVCSFFSDKCGCVFLLPFSDSISNFIEYLHTVCFFDHVKYMWITPKYVVKIRKEAESNDVYFIVTPDE